MVIANRYTLLLLHLSIVVDVIFTFTVSRGSAAVDADCELNVLLW